MKESIAALQDGRPAGLAVVTGASGGIGTATCTLLRDRGWKVAGMSRSAASAADVWIEVDVSDGADVARCFAELEAPGLVVHAAAVIEPVAPFFDADPGEWAGNVRVNVLGTFHVLHAATRRMLESDGGRIVTLTSGAAARAKPWWSAYSVSKAGVDHLVRSAGADLEGTAVSVCALDPGITNTAMQERVRAIPFPDRDRFVQAHEQAESRDPDEVARAILRLADRPAEEVNARIFRLDEA